MAIAGIDVSQVQGDIAASDWEGLAQAGTQFAYIRSGVGNDAPDTRFATNVGRARAAGLAVGAYNFVYPLPTDQAHPGRDPEAQAKKHFDASDGLGSQSGDLPMAVDVEWPPPNAWGKWGVTAASINAWLRAYLDAADALWNRPCIIYTYPSFAKSVGFDAIVGQRRLWIASYQTVPFIPVPWNGCVAQQTTGGGGKLPSGPKVDTDAIVDEATFDSLLA